MDTYENGVENDRIYFEIPTLLAYEKGCSEEKGRSWEKN